MANPELRKQNDESVAMFEKLKAGQPLEEQVEPKANSCLGGVATQSPTAPANAKGTRRAVRQTSHVGSRL